MIKLLRTTSNNPDFLTLVKLLDSELAARDGEVMAAFFGQHNKVPNLDTVLIAYENDVLVGCGAFKKFDDASVEVKRMFVLDTHRSRGIASKILNGLELWASELGFKVCMLETGDKQPEAHRLYEKNHYRRIDNFPPYVGVKESLCYKKILS